MLKLKKSMFKSHFFKIEVKKIIIDKPFLNIKELFSNIKDEKINIKVPPEIIEQEYFDRDVPYLRLIINYLEFIGEFFEIELKWTAGEINSKIQISNSKTQGVLS